MNDQLVIGSVKTSVIFSFVCFGGNYYSYKHLYLYQIKKIFNCLILDIKSIIENNIFFREKIIFY